MFRIFNKLFKKKAIVKEKHICNFKTIGYYYKVYHTEYINRFDRVCVYRRKICKGCGKTTNIPISIEEFRPSLHFPGEIYRIEGYIKRLNRKGIKSELEINLT